MALVTVEDQSSSDLFFLCSLLNGFVHQGLGVFRTELVGNDKPIEQVFDRGEIPPALLCGDVSDIGDPFLVGLGGSEIAVEHVLVTMVGLQFGHSCKSCAS